ncbi:MAG: hypothetical protein A2Z21_02230 [Candidatus Fraserbacteria bacterium RBG_16_55_9]|uniref:Uncharacterized protein n=1 Tax=Fraserbacteria sp. (strain RBG_16_55_9) TaxID=1817864 RepID=A0A1F5V1P9_FRAXR|nr:MAG: hypothetical protein A2Z21_02230 [Candidatus Fraserbacteria bacterium RBG_16_55_9]
MGKKKDYRKQLEGHRRALEEHLRKIAAERSKSRPRQWLLKLWGKQVNHIQQQIEKLERRLKQ